ncbi:DnaD domain protein [Halobacillus halophilus]|uniref:DnaD domain protein n=1 Tax=Halobacillus halophilus (strain ATCC 35676 / DSM 2266 / JCM 20832 / KCTC 3685 / LMG 17431 / NBRC 102448 / NCIMB 2269) TaxID=866895 RepID=I0JRG4_HALH3|nr:DnaD domain protein [Halobacillus halophilus]ASF40708.1 DnaD domain protein [Halobacillus halophilus]CCG46734.1 DnaD domain protein [Halobacillus halophilus DSM 2266]
MNYIKEINAFYDRMELDGLTTSEIVLWHTLMHFHNKAGWREEITLAATSILVKSGLTESAFKRARKQLKEKGYLTFRSVGKNQAPIYQLITREYPESGRLSDEPAIRKADVQMTEQMDQEATEQTNQSADALLKQKEIKRDKTTVVDAIRKNPHTFYEQNFGVLNPHIAESITAWCEDMPEELVLEAMKRALQQNKPFFQYSGGILKRWQARGVKTLEEVESLDLEVRRSLISKPEESPSVDDIFEEVRRERER